MRYSNTHHHRQGPDAESCTVRRKQEKTPSLERRATLSLWQMGKANKTSPKGVLFTTGEIIRMNITLQIEDFIHGIIKFGAHICTD